jgi:hypothetical protein
MDLDSKICLKCPFRCLTCMDNDFCIKCRGNRIKYLFLDC